jgi:hypothetical protein
VSCTPSLPPAPHRTLSASPCPLKTSGVSRIAVRTVRACSVLQRVDLVGGGSAPCLRAARMLLVFSPCSPHLQVSLINSYAAAEVPAHSSSSRSRWRRRRRRRRRCRRTRRRLRLRSPLAPASLQLHHHHHPARRLDPPRTRRPLCLAPRLPRSAHACSARRRRRRVLVWTDRLRQVRFYC